MKTSRALAIAATVTLALNLGVANQEIALAKAIKFVVSSASVQLPSAATGVGGLRYRQDIQVTPAIKGVSCSLAVEETRQNTSGYYTFLRNFTPSKVTNSKGAASITFGTNGAGQVASAMDVYAVCTFKGVTATDDPMMEPGQTARNSS